MNILDRIVETKKREIERLPPVRDVGKVSAALQERGVRDFLDAIRHPQKGRVALIAEVKKASPSKGVICPDFNPVAVAKAYEQSGASCLSVLTDHDYFQGSLEYLKQVRGSVDLPLLRKDFILDTRQIDEAVAFGADAILLIVAILDDAQLKHLHQFAVRVGLAVLVEVHDEEELRRAIAIGAALVGVNNRNLKDFSVDLQTTHRLAALWHAEGRPKDALLVAESGIESAQDVASLADGGANAILVGESLMRDVASIPQRIAKMLG
ncbi:MAG: indole-3-glycerol phosphate synthase TrpC [Verrucomicrobiota bacterium]|nr:indole-3-glycerol phosphate synthase TrpC [Verrucomicrobiota bacterium]